MLPFEGIIVAALNFGTALIELAAKDRETMDPDIRRGFDEVRLKGLQRVERILAALEPKG